MLILGIETSCDETSAAVVENGRVIRSNIVASQVDLHRKYGGVVPEIAFRRHTELIYPVIDEALEKAGVSIRDIQAVAVTQGPGLIGSLVVGVAVAKSLAYALGLPLVGVNHLEGHLWANFLEYPDLSFPAIGLVVSGGHTSLFYLQSPGEYEQLGTTRDDAVGEAFDKVAKLLGLGYPGGPIIDNLARKGNCRAIRFPQATMKDNSLDFSFSGLKTAVLYYLKSLDTPPVVEDVAASFQEAVIEVLVKRVMAAVRLKQVNKILLAGGVAANTRLREVFSEKSRRRGWQVYYPSPVLCTDNAAMVGALGYDKLVREETADWGLNAIPDLKLGTRKSLEHRKF